MPTRAPRMASRSRSRRPARKVSTHSSKRIAWTLAQSNKQQQQQQQHKSPVAVLWEAVRRSSAAGGRPLSLGAERGYEGKGFLGAAAGVRNGSVVGKGTERAQPCSVL